MDFTELIAKRHSVRKYSGEKVEDSKLSAILETGRLAPTAHNLQAQKVLIIQSEESLAKLKKGSNIYGAPLALVVCIDHEKSWKRSCDGKDSADIDASIVTSYMMLQATSLGFGSVWVCNFNPIVIKEEFNIPDSIEPINILLLGYALTNEQPLVKRKLLSETIVYDCFKDVL